jgi:hypothetical protein
MMKRYGCRSEAARIELSLVGQQLQPNQGRPKRNHPDLGYTEFVRERRGVCGEVIGHLAGQDADVQAHRGPGGHRDHLRSLHVGAAADAGAGLSQPKSGDQALHAPGEHLVTGLVGVFELPGAASRSPVAQQRTEETDVLLFEKRSDS